MVAGETAGGEAARADADRQKSAEQADVKFIQLQQFLAEKQEC